VWSQGQDVVGKIAEAYWVTSQYAEEIEADLQRYYGLDFIDLFRPGTMLTWRKLLILLHHLPPESALTTAMRNDTPEKILSRAEATADSAKSRWSGMETLLATLIDEVRTNTWVYVQAHSDQRVERPEPIRRPGLPARRERRMNLADAQKIDPRLRGLSEEEAQATLDRLTGRG